MDARTAISRPTRFMNRPDYLSQTTPPLFLGSLALAPNAQPPVANASALTPGLYLDRGRERGFSFHCVTARRPVASTRVTCRDESPACLLPLQSIVGHRLPI